MQGPVISAALLLAFFVQSAAAEDDVPGWIENGGWVRKKCLILLIDRGAAQVTFPSAAPPQVILVVAVLEMFYGLATVVEEFFVPALNTMCVKYGIPDDVAGATFMAAGASSPEMFAAFISLFITHSALGVGTIIGSELFNHLIICAGSIYYSRSGTIQCDPRLVGRECTMGGLPTPLVARGVSEVTP